jgi:hypothetical protein
MEAAHQTMAILDLGDGWKVGVCECGWASPNVEGRHRAVEAVRIHAILRAYDEALSPTARPAA